MKKIYSKFNMPKKILAFFVIVIIFQYSSFLINFRLIPPPLYINRDQYLFTFNESIKYFNVGLSRFFSGLIWIDTILQSDIAHYNKRDNNSWMFLRFKTIHFLDPKFLELYQFGGQYLAIVKDDLIGASWLYEEGLKIYPSDYSLNYNAAFLYFNELHDIKKALPLLIKVKNYPNSPVYLSLLISTLMRKEKIDSKLILAFLQDALKNTELNEMKESIRNKIRIIEAEDKIKKPMDDKHK